jgi:DNA-binding NtrC family response regulator
MLGRKEALEKKAFPIVLSEAFQKQMDQATAWIKRSPNVSVLHVDYAEVLSHPQEIAEGLCEFLDADLDIVKMVAAVDRSLYRNRLTETV